MTKTGPRGSFRRTAFNGLARTLGGIPLGEMEKFARKRGPEYERVIDKIKVQYW